MGNFDRTSWFYTIFKMEVTTWLSLLLAVISLGTTASASEPRVVCYYTNWSVYRPGTARFNPQNINPYLCTHLIYAFGGFTKDNTFKPFDKYQDIEKGGYAKFTGLKTYNKNLKTLLAIGGWNEGSTRFSPMVGSRERRKEFVRNAIKFLRQNRFDGLDLDWEYPAFRDGGKPKDRENYAKLVKELREEFDREAEKTSKPRLLLTMAVPAGIEYIQKGFDVKTLNKYLDWMNLLSYDYHSAFEPAVNHHAPLYPLEEPNEYSVDNELNIDYTIKFYIESGADPSKLVLGIPTYGRSYTLFNPDATEIGSPADGPGEQGDATREKGYLAYYEICEALKPKTKTRRASDEDSEEYSEEEEESWTVIHPNSDAMGPVAYKGNQWVGYDDEDIVRKKAEYVADNGLGGIMFWSIDNDDFRGTCHGKPYPLIEAAKESYYAKIGSSDYSVKERTTASTRPSTRRKSRPRSTTTTTTPKPTTAATSKRTKLTVTSTTPAWNIITPEPPTTPDPGSDFKCTDEGFYQHPRDCKKYFWCLDSGPSNLGIVAHQFTCPSGLYFNKAADSCDFARNVLCKKPSPTTKAPITKTTKPPTTRTTQTTTVSTTSTTTRRPVRLSTKSSSLFRTTSSSTTPEPEDEEEYDDDESEDVGDVDAEDPRVIKELIDLIKKVGGIEQLEKQLNFGENSQASTDGAIVTTPSSINKKLYQKVLERTRGQNKYSEANSISDSRSQNSRRGPQNAGLEPSNDRDTLLRKDRPQYVTINRQRGAKPTTESSLESVEIEEESEEQNDRVLRAKSVDTESRVGTTGKPLQYVNIRRARPPQLISISDTADDTASRNALFERAEPLVSVSDTPLNSLNILNSRRESTPEYVTIRRQRPTTEETTTAQYQNSSEEEQQETALEREISTQPQYATIVRSRSTLRPTEEPSTDSTVSRIRSTTASSAETSSPEPTTVLAVQISSLLNSPSSSEIQEPETSFETTAAETTTTTSTTTSSPSNVQTRRPVLIRRRGTTTTSPSSTAAPSSTTQVSPRNPTIINRRRPLPRPNEISSDSDDSGDLSRKIRSTTPDSREIDDPKPRETGLRRFRSRFQASQLTPSDDSVPAAASPVSRGQFKPQILNLDEVISLSPIEQEIIPRQSVIVRADRRFRRPTTSTAIPNTIPDSDGLTTVSETKRSNLLPRGRSRFTISTTTDPSAQLVTTSSIAQRRPTFARFTPRPFTLSSVPNDAIAENTEVTEETVTQKIAPRLPFGRTRPLFVSSGIVARRLPFPSRQSTTQQTLVTEDDDEVDEDLEGRSDDISLSESAREEKEHLEGTIPPKRRVIIKALKASSSPDTETVFTEATPIDDSGKKRFRVIRRRPSSTTPAPTEAVFTEASTASNLQRIRKVIRKKIKHVENEPEITAKSIGSLNSLKSSTSDVFNYGEKTRVPTITTEVITEPTIEEVTEFYKNKKVIQEVHSDNIDDEQGIEHILREEEENQVETTPVTTIDIMSGTDVNRGEVYGVNVKEESNSEIKQDTVSEETPDFERNYASNTNTSGENKQTSEKPAIESITETEKQSQVTTESQDQTKDISESKESEQLKLNVTETEPTPTETTTVSTTLSTSPTSRTRLPYRPRKKIFTPSTESSLPSTSRVFSRKYNPGVYTSPSTVERPQFKPIGSTRRPFSAKIFTRKPFTPKTTQTTDDDEEYSEEELEIDPEPFVFVPQNQLFSRNPDNGEEDDEETDSEELLEEEDDYDDKEEDSPSKFASTRRPGFKPRVVNSNTFRTSTTTTEIPKRLTNSQNKTVIITRFSGNKPVFENKKRVQNVPQGYNSPVNALKPKLNSSITSTTAAGSDSETTTSTDDDYLTQTSTTIYDNSESTTSDDGSTTNTMGTETVTYQMEINDSTDDYLEYNEGTTYYSTTEDISTNTQTEPEDKTTITANTANTVTSTEPITDFISTTTPLTITTTTSPPPIIKTQFDKLFSVSRVVEVSSKQDKHRLNKNNETTLIEEGKIVVEKKPVINRIGEVSRYSLIKIVEDEIPIYLTKYGHIYPVEHPPNNNIRIDEARNARALVETPTDIHKENLVASESQNEPYRHVKKVSDSKSKENKDHVEHFPNDEFLTYVNDESKLDKENNDSLYTQWQFFPAAYENEKVRAAKSFEIVTPRAMLTNPSTLALEGLFKTENPFMARKVQDEKNKPFLVYSAPVLSVSQQEEADNSKPSVTKSGVGRTIVTFAQGQTFNGGSVGKITTPEDYIDMFVIPLNTTESTTTSYESSTLTSIISTTTSTTERPSSPIIDLLSTTHASTEIPTTSSTEAISTTETAPEESTTVKISPFDAKRAKFGFPRRPIIKSSNFTRPSTIRTARKNNATVVSNLNQKSNKTTFNPTKSRFSANRVQNVPIDLKKKNNTPKIGPKSFIATKSYTTESPKTTTERKIYFKPIRPNFRPTFVSRKTTPPPVTGDT